MKKTLVEYGCIALGAFILACGINFFLLPCKISTGGVSGVGTVFYYVLNFPISATTLIINVILFAVGYGRLERTAILKTAMGIVFLSVFLEITDGFKLFCGDILIATVFGGVLAGVGVGMTVRMKASTGGSDFVAIMLNGVFPHVSVGVFILLIDTCVIALSGIVFKNYTIMFYSALSLYISARVTDFILVWGNGAKLVYIISKKNEEIARMIVDEMARGVTGVYAKGVYYNENNMMLMCVVKSREIPVLTENIKGIDKNAFTIISQVREVHGEGFKTV